MGMTKDEADEVAKMAVNLLNANQRIEELEAENTELKAQIADINDMLAMAERAGR